MQARGNKILRHDGAVKLILKAIAKGPKGGFYKIMDAGKEKDLTSDVAGKRVRPWLFPPIDDNLTAQEKRAETERRRKLRPDILVIEGLETANIRGKSTEEIRQFLTDNRHRLKVHILEVGYCGDLNHDQKDFDKRAQHAELVSLIRESDLTVLFHDPVTLGRCGSIPASFVTLMKDSFGLSAAQAEATAFQLNRHAVQWVDRMLTHRQLWQAPTGTHTHATVGNMHPAPQGHRPRNPG